jgi:drug/metabolite transporter (DMT)-like permease
VLIKMPETAGRSPYFYMCVMLLTGACNTLLMKFLCLQVASPGVGLPGKPFDFPFFQTMLMMLGELSCLAAFSAQQNNLPKDPTSSSFPLWVMALPVTCDWTATTLVNAAYVILPASTIQMCRGCVVVFTCLFSVLFLGRRQQTHQYFGVALVALGITIVSLQALLSPSTDGPLSPKPAWVGIGLTISAQLFQSTMLVVEEKYLSKYNVPPLQMVGLEGLFGSLFGVFLLAAMQVTGYEKASEAMYMMGASSAVQFGCVASMFSIAFFNWSGVSVTQTASAVARSTIDVSRTALIWAVELMMAWNTFSWLELVGFVVLIAGTLMYNDILKVPGLYSEANRRLSDDLKKDTVV